jgi:iron complex transport system ATP-binding protein
VIKTRDLSIALGGRRVVDGVSFEVDAGQVVGLVGPNGAGKSTLLKAMAGLIPTESGTVVVEDQTLGRIRLRKLARQVAYVAQETSIPFEFSALDVVVMGRYAHQGRFSPTTAADYDHARDALDAVGVAHLAERIVTTLSGGERQLVHLARGIAQQPRAILLDEPTSALDLRHQLHVLALLREQAARGRAIAVVLHDLNHAARFCDRIVLLDEGRVAAAGLPREVLTPARLADAYGITATVRDDADTGTLRVTALSTKEQ